MVGALALAAHENVPTSGIWVGMAAYAGFLWFARVAYLVGRGQEGMGLGDVKLALSLGASVGWLGSVGFDPGWAGALRLVVYAAMAGLLLGAVIGLVVLRRVPRGDPVRAQPGPRLARRGHPVRAAHRLKPPAGAPTGAVRHGAHS